MQKRVKQYFADDELLIGEKFWNFIYQSKSGYNLLVSSYDKHFHHISDALTKVKKLYLKA